MKNVMNLTPEEKFNQVIWWVLQEIKKESLATPKEKCVYFEPHHSDDPNLSVIDQRRALKLLEKEGAINIQNEKYPLGIMSLGAELYNWKPIGYYLNILQPKFDEIYNEFVEKFKEHGKNKRLDGIEAKTYAEEMRRQFEELRKKQEERNKLKQEILEEIKENGKKKAIVIPKTFEIQVRDRYIWVNEYLLSKPHAVGSNLEFFEYIRSKPAKTKIERQNLPSQFGSLSLKEQVRNKSFIKILNELGFKGEILKAFFPKRGKNMLTYMGDKITKKDLEKAGAKIPLFLKELEVAHLKNSPE